MPTDDKTTPDTKFVTPGAMTMTEDQQRQISEDLKAGRAGAPREKTYRVVLRTSVVGGRHRGGVFVPETPQDGPGSDGLEVNVTESQLLLLRADRAITVEGEALPPMDRSVKWPPEGLTPDKSPQMRGAAAADAPPDAMDSTGKMLDGSDRPRRGDPAHDDRTAGGDEPRTGPGPRKGARG